MMECILFILGLILKLIGSAVIIGIFILIAWVIVQNRNFRHFQRTMGEGSLCQFYVGNEKMKGRISRFIDDIVIVDDEEGDSHSFYKEDLYPL